MERREGGDPPQEGGKKTGARRGSAKIKVESSGRRAAREPVLGIFNGRPVETNRPYRRRLNL